MANCKTGDITSIAWSFGKSYR